MTKTVAFCLLTYRPDHPSGIERAIGALIEGLRQLGHTALVIAAGPSDAADAAEPGLFRLESVKLPRPARKDDVAAALAAEDTVAAEVRQILRAHEVDLVCWGAPVWGLGHISPAPPGTRTALLVHNTVRPGAEEPWRRALKAADVVCPASEYLSEAFASTGWDTKRWHLVPNALIAHVTPPTPHERERLRRHGPIRIVSRAEPVKGQAPFLAAMPASWQRRVEVVLAAADFEFERDAANRAIAACQREAQQRPGQTALLPALPWRQVPPFFAEAAVTVITTLEPETFSFTAAEALSAGTPVITFDHGHVPALAGPAGRAVPLDAGFDGLWESLQVLLKDHDDYHAASSAAPSRVRAHTPANAAAALLSAAGIGPA